MRSLHAVVLRLLRPFFSAILIALAFLALSNASIRRSTAQTTNGSISVSFGPGEIFNPSESFNRAVFDCGRPTVTCVSQVMQQNGASADAIAFYHLTGWMLTELAGGSPVQRGTVFVPWRANENSQPALLGGTPAVVLPEQEVADISTESWKSDPIFASLIASYPNMMFWGSGPVFETVDTSPNGGQRFIAFDFATDGTYQSTTQLGLSPPGASGG